MNNKNIRIAGLVVIYLIAVSVVSRAADKPAMDMKAMAEAMAKMGALNENHKLLEYMVGKWDYSAKMWMDPSAAPQESTGTTESKTVWSGRYFHSDHAGKMDMPGPDGKLVSKDFAGMALTGYDNMKQKFFTAWADSMGTGLLVFEGTYDPATKSFTYRGKMDCPITTPATKLKIRQVIKVVSADKHVFEWYEDRGDGKELRTMEITYTRKK